MLILTRRIGEAFTCNIDGGEIEVMILGSCRSFTKIGIKAPKEINIYRNELAKRQQNKS